jgi:hypothetical protein
MQIFLENFYNPTKHLIKARPCFDLGNEISILELTICNNSPSGFKDAHFRKERKYAPLETRVTL